VSDDDLPQRARGKRPHVFSDPAIDALLTTVLELAQDVWVLKERQRAYELYLEARGTGSSADFEAFALPEAESAALAAERQAYVQRLFRALEQLE
jgi:hypothetical protein